MNNAVAVGLEVAAFWLAWAGLAWAAGWLRRDAELATWALEPLAFGVLLALAVVSAAATAALMQSGLWHAHCTLWKLQ